MTPATARSESGDSTTSAARAPVPKPVQVSTPWGTAALVEELRVPQHAGDRRFASLVQLLELPKGDRLVRFAYATDGVARRGPITLREHDLKRLHELLERQPQLKATLGL